MKLEDPPAACMQELVMLCLEEVMKESELRIGLVRHECVGGVLA